MRKSIFSILTAVLFLASALLSCGPASDGGSLTEPEQTETAASEETEKSTEASVETESEEPSGSSPEDSSSEEPATLVPPSDDICTEDPTLETDEVPLTETARFDTEVRTDSESYCVLDAEGKILLEKNASVHLKPASITKILTALIVAEEMAEAHPGEDLDRVLETEMTIVSEEAVTLVDIMSSGISPSLKPGEVLTIKDLLYILMLPSTNSAGNVLAEYIAGSRSRFAALMNEKCKALGLKNSHFVNAHGLDSRLHYSCAYDLARILKAACENDWVRGLLSAKNYTVVDTALTEPRAAETGHEMLNGIFPSEGAFAGKTGWTIGANATLATAYERDGKRLYIVTMNSDERLQYRDTDALADAAYQLLAGVTEPSLTPRIYDVKAENKADGTVDIRFRVSDDRVTTRAICWNDAAGTASAFQLTPPAPEDGAVRFTLSAPGAHGLYRLQLFVYAKNGRESGLEMTFLYTGGPLPVSSITLFENASYFIDQNGFVKRGVIELPSGCYYADPETARIRYASFVDSGEDRYYASADGTFLTGWLTIGEDTYYFQPDGRMAIGLYEVNGTTYDFSEVGRLLQ